MRTSEQSHELAPLLEKIHPAISCFHAILDSMCQGSFTTSPGKVVSSAAQSRNDERKPWTVTFSSMSLKIFSKVMSDNGLLGRWPGKTRSLAWVWKTFARRSHVTPGE